MRRALTITAWSIALIPLIPLIALVCVAACTTPHNPRQ